MAVNSINLEFAFGILAAQAALASWKSKAKPHFSVALILIALLALFSVHASCTPEQISAFRGIIIGIPMVVFFYFLILLAKYLDIDKYRQISFYGDISYSIYLCHVLVLNGVGIIWKRLNVGSMFGDFFLVATWLAAVFVTGAFVYSYLEAPLVSYLRRGFDNGNYPPPNLER
jgi:exopolysaccharide production protein ExoZ